MALSTTTEPSSVSWRAAAIGLCVAHPAVAPCVALFMSTAGWSLMWAQALGIVAIFPQWLCILCFFGGLVLIARCATRARRAAGPR